MVKLDELSIDCQFGTKPGALWIDVEGYQHDVLEGANNLD